MPVLSVFGMKETFGAIYSNQVYEKERKELEEAGNSYEEMLKNYIEENKEEEHTGTKKADTDAGKESIKDGFEKRAQEYIKALKNGEKFRIVRCFSLCFCLVRCCLLLFFRPAPLPRLRKKAD